MYINKSISINTHNTYTHTRIVMFNLFTKIMIKSVHYDHGELNSFVESSVTLAQCLLYARVFDENCMITSEDFAE
jgi:hypothetical protein